MCSQEVGVFIQTFLSLKFFILLVSYSNGDFKMIIRVLGERLDRSIELLGLESDRRMTVYALGELKCLFIDLFTLLGKHLRKQFIITMAEGFTQCNIFEQPSSSLPQQNHQLIT
jgi:hypothetical protein